MYLFCFFDPSFYPNAPDAFQSGATVIDTFVEVIDYLIGKDASSFGSFFGAEYRCEK
jgi:hypothetical protein